jgi:hypothetical protein
MEVVRKARLGLYLKDEEIKRLIKVAAAKRGLTTTNYCAQAIEERLRKDGEITAGNIEEDKMALLSRMDKLSEEIGLIGVSTAELVEEGRRR